MLRQFLAMAVLGAAFIAGPASATTWEYTGVITNCNAAICSLVPVFTGDPVTGTVTVNVGANDSFTLDNTFMDFSFLVGGVIPIEFPNPNGVFLTGSGTTDANGDFASGMVTGEFVGGTLGGLLGQVVIDLATGTMQGTVGGGTVFVADVEGTFRQVVPIPAGVWLMASALFGLAGLRRRRTA